MHLFRVTVRLTPLAVVATFVTACGVPLNGTGSPWGSSSSASNDPVLGPDLAPGEDASNGSSGTTSNRPSANSSSRSSTDVGGSDDAMADDGGDASANDSTTDAQAQPYKGVALYESTFFGTDASFGNSTCPDLATLGVSWYSNWTTATSCASSAEFVPQIWGHPYESIPTEIAAVVAAGRGAVLGFNEPDNAAESNLSVAQAVALWPEITSSTLRVGSPATSSTPSGQDWMSQFMGQASMQGLRVDFITLHWTGRYQGPANQANQGKGDCSDASTLESYIRWAEQWQRPIWLTEWSCQGASAGTVQSFYEDALAMFAQHPLLERYAWYLSRSSDANALIESTTGVVTPLGMEYEAAPATR
jgi:hypothetical protein